MVLAPKSKADSLQEYLVRRIAPGEAFERLGDFPRYIEMETVNACNARCSMCTIEEWTRKSPVMRDELFDKIAAEICEHADTVKRVSLYKDGEPLLDKKLADRVALFKAGNIRQVAISTNVSLLDEQRATELLQAGLDLIILSIDSLRPEVFETIRIKLNHAEVMRNALRFIELRDRLRPSARIWVRMIRQESNYEEWPVFERFWRERLAPDDRVNYHNIHNWGGQLNGFRPVHQTLETALPCIALWSSMVIFSNGDVPLCTIDYNNSYPTGQVRDHTIAEVWRSEVIKERRALHLDGRKACISLCADCNVWDEPPDQADKIAPGVAAAIGLGALD